MGAPSHPYNPTIMGVIDQSEDARSTTFLGIITSPRKGRTSKKVK